MRPWNWEGNNSMNTVAGEWHAIWKLKIHGKVFETKCLSRQFYFRAEAFVRYLRVITWIENNGKLTVFFFSLRNFRVKIFSVLRQVFNSERFGAGVEIKSAKRYDLKWKLNRPSSKVSNPSLIILFQGPQARLKYSENLRPCRTGLFSYHESACACDPTPIQQSSFQWVINEEVTNFYVFNYNSNSY